VRVSIETPKEWKWLIADFILQEVGETDKMNGKPRIVNVVATGRFPCKLDIEKLSQEIECKERIYEPEIYPALLVKVGEKRYHITLYANGKYIITGVESEGEVMEAYEEIRKKLRECGYLRI
jgi:TATA-box binding protein (TBP) (component of TFIID and TFIIIB)